MNRPSPIAHRPSSSPHRPSSIAHRPSLPSSPGFTLVELLVVIGIIALLAAILLPAMNAAFNKAEKSQAQVEVRSILAAIQAYNNEYGKVPVRAAMQGNNDDSAGDLYAADISKSVIKALNGIHDSSANGVPNPRKIAFLDSQGSSTDGTFNDPWGDAAVPRQYLMKMDTDYSNSIRYTNTTYSAVAVVVSFGPDGVQGGGDDITSF